MTTLFVIAQTWKQPRCSALGNMGKPGTFRQWDIIQS